MELFPAIDLRDGKAVRLLRGDYDKMTVYSDSPVDTAKSFEKAGAKYLHLVDLDGAKDGKICNFKVIDKIVNETCLNIEVGGGIRDTRTIERYLDIGVMRVILGTSAVTDPEFVEMAVTQFGDKIAVGVDLKDGFVATHGWTKVSSISGIDFCLQLQDLGVDTIICTDISRDGAMKGINESLYRSLVAKLSVDIIASGGVTSIDNLIELSRIGVAGAIMGKSIYTGSIDLARAIEAVKKAE